jgi:hypothetical protein
MNPNHRAAMLLTATALATSTTRGQDPLDMWVGKSAGKVALSPAGFIPGSAYNPLFRVDQSFLHGWSNANPGFDHATSSVGGVSPLTSTVQIQIEVVALDPALVAFGPAFSYTLESPGQRGLLGGADLHTHVTWFIDEDDPGFDPGQCVWAGTFKLVATAGGLQPSLPFTLRFANVPVRGGEFPPTPTPASGDFDEDSDVDGEDAAAFAACSGGPQRRPAPDDPTITICEVDCFNALDFDDDMDIDLADFADFQMEYNP